MIVDNILIGLVNEVSFRKSGFVWKVATSCSGGWNYFGRERWGCLWLLACLAATLPSLSPTHPPPSLSSVGQTQIRFLVPKFGLEIWPIFTSMFFKRVGRMIIMAALYQVYAYYVQFLMEWWLFVTFRKNSKIHQEWMFCLQIFFSVWQHNQGKSVAIKIWVVFSQKQEIACVIIFTTSSNTSSKHLNVIFFRQWGRGQNEYMAVDDLDILLLQTYANKLNLELL